MSVSGLTSGVAAINAGRWHTCALLTTGGVKCWGRNGNGQLGNGNTTQQNTPVDVSGLTSGVASVDAGGFHTCAVTTSGGVKCWGINTDGEVGDGTITQRTSPVDVSGLASGVATVNTSYYHTCAVTTGSAVKCWGKNDYNQLSDPSVAYSSTPLAVTFPTVYTYGDSAHKHAVTALNSGETYTYDANGNMITRVENGLTYNQVFDAENRLTSVTVCTQTTQFIYDGDGNMVKKIKPDSSKTIYVGGVYEVDKTSGGSVTRTVTYYPAGGAMRINIVGGSNTLYYILKDQLGSASVVTDAITGLPLGEQRYYPYGETRWTTGTIYTDKLYTGQRDTGLGVYDYGARMYDPKLGRFLSPDTIGTSPSNPQSWNRYSYVTNNPLRYTDPTGHMQYENSYTSNNGKCGKGDTSCNWVGKTSKKPKPKPTSTPTRNPGPFIGPGPTATPTPTVTPGSVIQQGPTATATFAPPPFIDPVKTAVAGGVDILNITKPSYEPFDAIQFWNTIGNGLPVLGQHFPATSVAQVVTAIANVGISVAQAGTNAVNNIAYAVGEATDIVLGGLGPTLPIFIIPSNNPFSPTTGSS